MGSGIVFGVNHLGQNGTNCSYNTSTPVTNTPMLFNTGVGTFQGRSKSDAPTPFSHGGLHGPHSTSRPNIDPTPIRTEHGLTFAEMLALNANANGTGGTEHTTGRARDSNNACRAFCKIRKSSHQLRKCNIRKSPFAYSQCPLLLHPSLHTNVPDASYSVFGKRKAEHMLGEWHGHNDRAFSHANATRSGNDGNQSASVPRAAPTFQTNPPPVFERSYRIEPVYRASAHTGQTATTNAESLTQEIPIEIPHRLDYQLGVPVVTSQCFENLSAADSIETHIIDVRYSHEFRAGHIRGAVHCPDPLTVQRYVLHALSAKSLGESSEGQKPGGQKVFVFVCDKGSERSPRVWRHVRALDRKEHIASYPDLSVPQMFCLEGGFESFVGSHGPQWCTGPAISVDEGMFADEGRSAAAHSRDAWRLAAHADGLTKVPDGSAVRVLSSLQKREIETSEEWWGEEIAMRE